MFSIFIVCVCVCFETIFLFSVKTYTGDLEMFLTGLKLQHFIPVFHCHELNLADVLKMRDDDLIKVVCAYLKFEVFNTFTNINCYLISDWDF